MAPLCSKYKIPKRPYLSTPCFSFRGWFFFVDTVSKLQFPLRNVVLISASHVLHIFWSSFCSVFREGPICTSLYVVTGRTTLTGKWWRWITSFFIVHVSRSQTYWSNHWVHVRKLNVMFTIIIFTLSIILTFCRKYTNNSCNISYFTKTASHANENTWISSFQRFCGLEPDDIDWKGKPSLFLFFAWTSRGFKISRHASAQLARGLKLFRNQRSVKFFLYTYHAFCLL